MGVVAKILEEGVTLCFDQSQQKNYKFFCRKPVKHTSCVVTILKKSPPIHMETFKLSMDDFEWNEKD